MTGPATQTIDHVALLPAYLAAGTAVLVLCADLLRPGRYPLVLALTALGATGTGVAAWLVGAGGRTRATFCVPAPGPAPAGGSGAGAACSYVVDPFSTVVAVLFAALTVGVVGLSVATLRSGTPAGESGFLLACSLTGGVVLGSARDLITLVVAVETLTLPLYVLVGFRNRDRSADPASAQAAVTFFVVSVVASSVALLGAALLYGLTGAVHLGALADALAGRPDLRDVPLTGVAVTLLLVGLSVKVAAVPLHAWAAATYDGAPLPVAAYLSTASKLGGVVALLLVTVRAVGPWLDVAGTTLAVLAVLTMTVGNLVALRQRRTVRLLAWSSVAQAGYILAPLGAFALAAGRTDDLRPALVAATLAYTVFFVVLELTAFAAVVALRSSAGASDGGTIEGYRGSLRRAPWVTGALLLALAGLAGLPPGLAGLFAKVSVVRALVDGGSGWLALVVAVNAVLGLAYYARVAVVLCRPPVEPVAPGPGLRQGLPVAAVLTAATVAALIVGFAPQLVLAAAAFAAR